MATSQDFVNWVCGPDLLPRYLLYVLLSEQESIRRFAHGTTHQTMYYPEAKALHICLPSLVEQRAIAEVLGALDDKIEANQHLQELCESITVGLFDLATNEARARLRPLFEVVEFVFGEPFRSDRFQVTPEGRRLIRIRDLKTFQPQIWTTETRRGETVVEPGDVVMGMDAEFRPTFWLGEPGLLNQRVCLARPRVGGRTFVRELLKKPLSRIEAYKTGTTVAHLNKQDLMAVQVPCPPESTIENFDLAAEPYRELIVATAAETRILGMLRDTLLPKLMSGELRVRDAKALVGEHV